MHVSIRQEQREDVVDIRRINEEAFGQPQEARLVDMLRAKKAVLLSLVATADHRTVGHILFSPVRLDSGPSGLVGAGLGPMAVVPEFQRIGIGSKLIAEGIEGLRDRRCPFVVVVGHPEYYPRFGFVPASCHNIRCEWEVPEEAFMVLMLDQSRLHDTCGMARYQDEFVSVA